ncbi:DUF2269 family protein [Paenibacillus sp. GXUN7292]|uniref:DUF2269 family protein n=1 Tax=Paenibacillus sp. GXUN7292 TaxID=3422499 RepID=UPI003D7C455C
MINYIVHYIHVLVAVTSLGVALVFPIMSRTAKTSIEARQTVELFQKLKFVPHIGSLILAVTTGILLSLEPKLVTQSWFVYSLVVYFLVQVYVAGSLPRRLKNQMVILEAHTEEEVPIQYRLFMRKFLPIEMLSQLLAVLLIFLLVFKPM